MSALANSPAAWSERASAPSSWDACGWSEHGQTQRFIAALRHLDLRKGDTLLDFGAGTGRFSEFLPREIDYFAYDWAPGMLERVEREHERANALHELPDVLFDHVVAIGVFNLRDNWTREQTWQRLAQLWNLHTRRTLVVSLYRGEDMRCFDYSLRQVAHLIEEWLRCEHFVVDADYLTNDLMLVCRR
jgi:SAM-dependent methyltransferase